MMMKRLDEDNKKKYINMKRKRREEAMKQIEKSKRNSKKKSNKNKDLLSDLTYADFTTTGEFYLLKKS